MGLSDDQRAMLRLLAQRGEEGYDDVAALMGLSVEEVRAKVAEALAVLAEEGALAPTESAAPVAPQAEPPAPEPPAPEPEVAAEPEPKPPAAEKPPTPAPRPPAPPKPAKRQAATPPKVSLPAGKGPRAAIGAALLVLVALVVVLIVSGGDSGSDADTTSASNTTSGETTSGSQQTTSNNAEVTKAVLKPVDGSDASGAAIFGRVKNSLALQVVAKGLPATTKGQTEYTVWLAQSPQRMLPLASTQVKADGRIGAQFEVPTEVLAYLANGTFDQLVITRTENATLEAALAQATKEERAPKYTGTEVLRGTVVGPVVGAAKRLEEEKEAEKGE